MARLTQRKLALMEESERHGAKCAGLIAGARSILDGFINGTSWVNNVTAYTSSPIRYASMQAAALNTFDTAWAALQQACGQSSLGAAGQRCISATNSLFVVSQIVPAGQTTFTAPFTTAFTDIGAAFAAGSISPLTTEDWMVILGSAAAFYYIVLDVAIDLLRQAQGVHAMRHSLYPLKPAPGRTIARPSKPRSRRRPKKKER